MYFKNCLKNAAYIALVTACFEANAFSFLESKLPNKKLHMVFDIEQSSPTSTSYNEALEQAVHRWTYRQSEVSITTSRSSVSDSCGSVPGQHTVIFATKRCSGEEFGSAIAVASTYYFIDENGDAKTSSSTISFDSERNWDIFNSPLSYNTLDFRRVAVHEIGHVLGLGHEDSHPAIMNSTVGNTISPQKDDIDGITALYSASSSKPDVHNILEEPAADSLVSGVSNIRGWAVGLKEIERIELSIDGKLIQSIPYGGIREDVKSSFPDYPDSDRSGYSMIFNWANLSAGNHQISTKAVDVEGNSVVSNRDFTVLRFDNPFINGSKTVAITGDVKHDNQDVILENVLADGVNYRVRLRWNSATQQWDTTEISKK
ncbi:matrixin family metalloprotease [Pseudoteredinibacter isoporae]|uniref:matrixin family metalloprotease n=1 Tax=Pseudoteredinibacter isoporae TaxID=570281 RepID=UPI00310793A8